MKVSMLLIAGALFVTSCDTRRVYEKNQDFAHRYWLAADRPQFEFEIQDPSLKYNIYINVRTESNFPNANLYYIYTLTDSTGKELEEKLVSEFLFDKKTGKPLGSSGLGDIYDHRFLLLPDYSFSHPGKYRIHYEQFMRTDTLRGILAIGLRVEQSEAI